MTGEKGNRADIGVCPYSVIDLQFTIFVPVGVGFPSIAMLLALVTCHLILATDICPHIFAMYNPVYLTIHMITISILIVIV